MKYARQCSITGEGMNEGWVWGDGAFYTKYEKDTLAECRKDRDGILYDTENVDDDNLQDIDRAIEFHTALQRTKDNQDTDEDLLLIAYQTDYLYWTEWECPTDLHYEEVNGKLIEINQ
tara:strand:+ start:1187 stop:1540 length:354 start_codon:yes stop_codon:yes gene_type:complete